MDLGLIRAGGIIEAKVSLPEGNGGAAALIYRANPVPSRWESGRSSR